eukprot:403336899
MGGQSSKDGLNSSQKLNASNKVSSLSASFFQEVDESVLDKDPLFRTMNQKKKVSALFKINDIKTPILKTIFLKDSVGTLELLEKLKIDLSRTDYEHDLVVAFWFAVHNENFEIARHILNSNIYIRQLVTLALFKKGERQNVSEDKETDLMRRQIFQARKQFERSMRENPDQFNNSNDQSNQSNSNSNNILNDNSNNVSSPFDSHSDFESSRNMQQDKQSSNFAGKNISQLSRRGRNNQQKSGQIDQSHPQQTSGTGIIKKQKSILSNKRTPFMPVQQQRQSPKSNRMNFEGGELENDSDNSESDNSNEYDDEQEDLEESSKMQNEEEDVRSPQLDLHDLDQDEGAKSDDSEQAIFRRNQDHLDFLKQQGISEFSSLMTNILKILLFKQEEKLACMLTAYYELAIDDDMIFRAIENMHYHWLQFVWAFKKNFLGPRNSVDSTPITYTQLFDIIKNMYESTNQIKEGIRFICQWMLITDDNILLALLYHYQDNLALDYMGYYDKFIDKDLFLYSMNHGNKMFLQHALLIGAFDKTIFKEEDVISQILIILKQKKIILTTFYLEMAVELTLCQIELIQVFQDYVDQSFEQNLLLLSYNPLMSIALTAEILKYIANSRKRFENECNKIYDDILELGKMFTSKIDDEKYYENLIMDKDFREKSVLKIITENTFEPLIPEDDPKPENLMIQIWQGREATRCDGNIYGHSNMMHVIWTKAKKTGGKSTFFQLISNFFEVNFTVDYTFQYRYRTRSIAFYFQKEFFFSFVLLILFQLINYDYLSFFRGPSQYLAVQINPDTKEKTTVFAENFDIGASLYDFSSVVFQQDDLTDKERFDKIAKNQVRYQNWEAYVLLLSCSLLFSLFLKQFFNLFSKTKIAIDKWTLIDTLNGTMNIAGFIIVISASAVQLNDPVFKNNLDYIMIFVLVLSWIRFFIYFLVVRDISKMLLTIWEMLADTLSFIFIVICYFVVVASVFTTLYQDTNPDKFGGLAISARTLYDSAMAVYDYKGMGSKEISFSLIQIVHIFLANILLMNFLIAILSFTYENTEQISHFKYKVNLYKYCERYLIAFENDVFGEIVLHTPPINYFVLTILPFMVNSVLMKKVTKGFSYAMFWAENVIFVFIFLIYEICLIPAVYIKTFINIVSCSVGLFTIMFQLSYWFFSGIFFSFFLIFRDIYYLLKILSMHQGCRQAMGLADELKEDVIDKDLKLKVYNEIRETVIAVYLDTRKMNNGGDDYDSYLTNGNFNDLDVLVILEQDSGKFDSELFVVKQSVIHDEWKKRKARQVLTQKKSMISPINSPTKSQMNKKGSTASLNEGSRFQQISRKGTSISKGGQTSGITPKESVASLQKIRKNQAISDLIGGKKTGSASAKIVEAMFQKPKLDDDQSNDEDEEDEENEEGLEMDQNKLEEEIVEEFLKKFVIVSESSTLDQINILIMMKAIPNEIVDYNLEQNELFNFKTFQDSLVAFQNLDMVNAFEYFDEKNRERVQNVKDMLVNQRTNLNSVHDIISHVKQKVQKNEDIFAQFTYIQDQISGGAPQDDRDTVTGGGRSVIYNNDSQSNNNFDDDLTGDNDSRMSAGKFSNTLLKLRGVSK